MSEGNFSPRVYPPKPLTRAQLRAMEKRFAKASKQLDKIKDLEEKHQEDIDLPKWI